MHSWGVRLTWFDCKSQEMNSRPCNLRLHLTFYIPDLEATFVLVILLFLQGSKKLFRCRKNTHALRIPSLIELLLNFRKLKQHNYCTCLMFLVVSEDVQGRQTFNFSGRTFNAF